MDNLLDWIQQIYSDDFCNGSWEHVHGVTINTLDPGWDFKFDIKETDLEKMEFQEELVKRDENDWYQCWIEDGVFRGWGGSKNLTEIFGVFKKWYINAVNEIDNGKNT